MNLLTQILLLFLAGGLGTLSRFGLGSLITRIYPHPEPWGTMIINIVGCLCFGIIAEAFQLRAHWSLQTRVIILTGFFGAFTTFSTYMYEIHSLMINGSVLRACLGFTIQNALGFLGIAAGVLLVKNIFTP